MVTTKHCCWADCKSDSRCLDAISKIYFIGLGNGFPHPVKNLEKCKRWVQNCSRKYFSVANITKDTYICSLHFVGGHGPTEEHPDPIKPNYQVIIFLYFYIYSQLMKLYALTTLCKINFVQT